KFLIDLPLASEVREWARVNLTADPYGAGPAADAYTITTLYLDTKNFDVLQRNNSYGRAKYRVRRYGECDRVFVERKMKVNDKVRKRRSELPACELDALRNSHHPQGPAYWFQRRMRVRQLAPVCCVTYNRIARMASTERGPI